MRLNEYSLEEILVHLMQLQNSIGLQSMINIKHSENPKVKSMSLVLDPNTYSGIRWDINPQWLREQVITDANVIEMFAKIHAYRIIARHLVDMFTTHDIYEEGGEKRASMGSQIAAVSNLKDALKQYYEKFGMHPEKYQFPEQEAMETYIHLIKQNMNEEELDKMGEDSRIGFEDFSEGFSDSLSPGDRAAIQSKLNIAAVEMAHAMEKSCGTLPQALQQKIDEILRPNMKIPWQQLLRDWLSGTVSHIIRLKSEKIRKKRLGLIAAGFPQTSVCLFPGYHACGGPTIAVLIDASGSISDEDFVEALNVIKGMQEQIAGIKIYCVQFDTVPHQIYLLEDPSQSIRERAACGGTDIAEAQRWVLGRTEYEGLGKFPEEKISTMVIITDGYGPALPKTEIPDDLAVIWVMTEASCPWPSSSDSHGTVSYGLRLNINDD